MSVQMSVVLSRDEYERLLAREQQARQEVTRLKAELERTVRERDEARHDLAEHEARLALIDRTASRLRPVAVPRGALRLEAVQVDDDADGITLTAFLAR